MQMKTMNWTLWIIVAAVIAVFLLLKQGGQIKAVAARTLLKQGAKVIDVRTEAEYREAHLEGAINLPLDRLRDEIARVAPDKNQPLLLHCRSGTRSGMGKRALEQIGYTRAYNLGSYGRAASIMAEAETP